MTRAYNCFINPKIFTTVHVIESLQKSSISLNISPSVAFAASRLLQHHISSSISWMVTSSWLFVGASWLSVGEVPAAPAVPSGSPISFSGSSAGPCSSHEAVGVSSPVSPSIAMQEVCSSPPHTGLPSSLDGYWSAQLMPPGQCPKE